LAIVPAAADDEAPTQLITLNLFTNWYHTKVAKRETPFASYKTFRMISPNQHTCFRYHISAITLDVPTASTDNVQLQFKRFYNFAINFSIIFILNVLSVTSHDPHFVTPTVKAKLRRKNRLMRRECMEEASALAYRIGKDIERHNRTVCASCRAKRMPRMCGRPCDNLHMID